MSLKHESTIVKKSLWNWISLVIFATGLLLGFLAVTGKLTNGSCGQWIFNCFLLAMAVFILPCILGFFAAITAFVRGERRPVVTWIGLILNGFVVLAAIVIWLMIVFR